MTTPADDGARPASVIDPVPVGADPSKAAETTSMAVYATITILGVVSAATWKHVADDAVELALVVLGTTLTLMIAHAWSSVVAHRLVHRRRFTREEIVAEFVHDGSILITGVVGAATLGVATLFTDDFDTQIGIEQSVLVGALVVIGVVGARRSGASWPRAFAWGAIDGGVGVLIVLLKMTLGS